MSINRKLQLNRFFVKVIWHQIFSCASVAKAVELAKEDLGDDLPHKYDRSYATRVLNRFEYQSYKRQLLASLAELEPRMTEEIAILN